MFLDGLKSSKGSITALRVLRLMRVFSIAKYWKDFYELIMIILSTLHDLSNIIILLCIFMLSFMLIGMELFGFKLPEKSDDNFGTFDRNFTH
jgi:hypothetical protein